MRENLFEIGRARGFDQEIEEDEVCRIWGLRKRREKGEKGFDRKVLGIWKWIEFESLHFGIVSAGERDQDVKAFLVFCFSFLFIIIIIGLKIRREKIRIIVNLIENISTQF